MSLKQNYDLSEKDCPVYENYVHAEVCAELERELAASKAEVERLGDAFSHLTDEIECTSKCNSHIMNYCNCERLTRAYAISDSIPQNPTK
jgi:hypothetical protein